MNRLEFLKQLEIEFPDGFAEIDTSEQLLHCEIADFREWVVKLMDEGSEWKCQQVFEFMVNCLNTSDSSLENAIEISFIEDLALGEHKVMYRNIVKARAPKALRNKMAKVHSFWS